MKAKKYITTDTHPELKEGIYLHFEYNFQGKEWYSETRLFSYSKNQFEYALEKGYIKELQEPEFTKDDMIKFAIHWANAEAINGIIDIEDCFTDWNVEFIKQSK